jgi:hypothetical protein
MELNKLLTWMAMAVAGLVCLVFILDLAVGILGRNIALDVLFLLGGALVLWQGIETVRELR